MTAGLPPPTATMPLSAVTLVAEERTLKGSYIGTAVPSRDIPRYIELYQRGRLPVDRLMSGTLSLDEINEGFDRLHDGQAIRQVWCCDELAMTTTAWGRHDTRPHHPAEGAKQGLKASARRTSWSTTSGSSAGARSPAHERLSPQDHRRCGPRRMARALKPPTATSTVAASQGIVDWLGERDS